MECRDQSKRGKGDDRRLPKSGKRRLSMNEGETLDL